jgi:hypothetical protein
MNTLDSQHLDYNENDFFESNPFADTPSKSTELSKSIIHNEEEEIDSVEQEREMTPEQELVSEEEEEEMIHSHQGEQVTSPISTVNQLEELCIEPEVETDTQVSSDKKKEKIPGIFLTRY